MVKNCDQLIFDASVAAVDYSPIAYLRQCLSPHVFRMSTVVLVVAAPLTVCVALT